MTQNTRAPLSGRRGYHLELNEDIAEVRFHPVCDQKTPRQGEIWRWATGNYQTWGAQPSKPRPSCSRKSGGKPPEISLVPAYSGEMLKMLQMKEEPLESGREVATNLEADQVSSLQLPCFGALWPQVVLKWGQLFKLPRKQNSSLLAPWVIPVSSC